MRVCVASRTRRQENASLRHSGGCANYAKAKGHSEWYGLLAFFFLPGLIVLMLLKDRYKHGSAWSMTMAGVETETGQPDRLPLVPIRCSSQLCLVIHG
jgi:hypothetical protein